MSAEHAFLIGLVIGLLFGAYIGYACSDLP